MSAQAGQLFGVNSAAAATTLSKGDIGVRKDQAIGDLVVQRDQQGSVIETNRAADTQNWVGSKVIMGSDWVGGLVGGDGKSSGRKIAGEAIKVGGSAYGLYQQYDSIQNRAEGQQSALHTATGGLIDNQNRAADGQTANQNVYLQQMTGAHQQFAQGQIDAANAGVSQAAGGVNRGTSITIGGINQGASLEQRANKVTFEGSVKAAGQVRDASFEAARLHAMASVISAVGHNLAREIEHGLTLRY